MADEITLTQDDVDKLLKTQIAREEYHGKEYMDEEACPHDMFISLCRLALKSFDPNPARALIEKMRDALKSLMVASEENPEAIYESEDAIITAAELWLKANPQGEL